MAVTGESTLAAIEAEMDANADFAESGSGAKAKAFAAAARIWLRKVPKASARSGSSLAMNVEHVQAELDRAYQYVQLSSGTSGGVKFLGADTNFR
ncbi:MAG: hypothetical protein IT427_12845 [Pirellulales bacterium]|nr:hypothetical protein [Pirellulales bacterium]